MLSLKSFLKNLQNTHILTIFAIFILYLKCYFYTTLSCYHWSLETNRKHKIPRSERFCKLCNTGEVENELHFILNCPTLSQVRDNFLNSLSGTNKAFSQLPPESKLRYLYFNEYLPQPELHTAANMLEALKVKRDALLS